MASSTDDLLRSPALAALGDARPGGEHDAIEGVVPRLVVAPATAAQAAATLAWASSERLQTVVRGGATKIGWGRIPGPIDLIVSTARLNRVLVHRHGDLTATIEAGATLGSVNQALSAHRQWLPLGTAFEGATIGGVVASNDSGPLRHRYGTSRDLLIGITLAMTDGRLVKAGGHVVKNVAGYDLGKLMSGSFGALALVVDATFKLSPVPQVSNTIVAMYDDGEALARDAATLGASQLEPVACDVHAHFSSGPPDYRLLVRFATSPSAAQAQAAAAAALLHGRLEQSSGGGEMALWHSQTTAPWAGAGAIVRAAWLPAALPQVLAALREIHHGAGAPLEFAARAAVGSGLVRIEGDEAAQLAAIQQLRGRANLLGHVVVLRASPAVKREVDVWGGAPGAAAVVRALKQALDPAAILNAGRGPV